MKRNLVITVFGLVLLVSAVTVSAQSKSRSVAFRTVKGEPSRYITASGDLLTSASQTISTAQTFTLIDMNGEELEEGDSIKIKYGDKYWREDNGSIVLSEGIPDKACLFTLERSSKFILLRAHNDTWVSAPGHGGTLETSNDKNDSYRVLELKYR